MLSTTRLNLRPSTKAAFWTAHRESARNWLALGMLLAAWNAVDSMDNERDVTPKPRPESLRGYPVVSVRAMHRSSGD
jgi:hypothetical protein